VPNFFLPFVRCPRHAGFWVETEVTVSLSEGALQLAIDVSSKSFLALATLASSSPFIVCTDNYKRFLLGSGFDVIFHGMTLLYQTLSQGPAIQPVIYELKNA